MEDEKDYKDFKTFKLEITRHKGTKAKVRNSWGIYDAYKLLRKNKWLDIGRPLKEHEFYTIIREVNNLVAKEIGKGNTVTFPSRMGRLELRKFNPTAKYVNGKLIITYPVNWDETLKLWYTDKEARKAKTLIRRTEDTVYTIKYSKYNADYANQSFYEFAVNNKIRKDICDNVRAGIADTPYLINGKVSYYDKGNTIY